MSTQIEKKVSLSIEQVAEIGHHVLEGMESAAAAGFNKYEIIMGALFLLGMSIREVDMVFSPSAPVSEMLPSLVRGYNTADTTGTFLDSVQRVH